MDSLSADVQYIRQRVDALTEMYGETQAAQATALAKIESLAGNGQPGRVGVMERRQGDIESAIQGIGDRLSGLEGKLWWLLGGGAVAAVGVLDLILRLKALFP